MPYSRVVIVSGASRGVGAAIARWLASAGSAVTLISHSEGALDDIDLGFWMI
jgi:NAD(P)-dependent dehydrogenase (short-subunit alcohol dehydrogenase family)